MSATVAMKVAVVAACTGLLAILLLGCGSDSRPSSLKLPTYTFKAWSDPIRAGTCSLTETPLDIQIAPKLGTTKIAHVTCARDGSSKAYKFPPGVFEIDEQFLVPENISISGAQNPNHMSDWMRTPDWTSQTLFLATRGVTDYNMDYCHAKDMVTTRVGFVLSSFVTIRDVSYQGIDTIRPNDNGALCGGAAFETKGCAENDCKASNVNNGGSNGIGSVHVLIENVRLNDFYYAADKGQVGANIPGNSYCESSNFTAECCFCKPNGIRSSQVGIWVPETRNAEGSHNIIVSNVVSLSTQADGINLHGFVRDALVQNTYFENTGDDTYALWGANLYPENVTFKNCVAVNPGILRPNWYGNCVATYGLKSVIFDNLTCMAPTLEHPIPTPGDENNATRIDTSMFVFYTSFGGIYPEGNNVTIKNWTFEDLNGNVYTPETGSMDMPSPGKMAWTKSGSRQGSVVAPYFFPDQTQQVNVYVAQGVKFSMTGSQILI